jgi:hypothetical protein
LIINHLRTKTHENTGKKPAKPEINNKQNIIPKHQPSKKRKQNDPQSPQHLPANCPETGKSE